ncbi:cytochrome P450 [Amylibacter sp. SFDW26]|uniref:cytochrome P450 n=1 Tax=Amylibacter sp. SFDW26 TaxID=2652722 RepID=UPI001261D366|nr:cytochrome P450 [Amylibacter sp. SFDW26]KAB7614830.1 cytochrome P450 [Amylibacter sp. SFDW26]
MTKILDAGIEPPKVKLVTDVWGPIQSLMAARRNVLEIIPLIATKQPIVSGKMGSVRWHMVMDPTAIGRMLKEKLDIYPKSDITKNMLKPAIGESMFIAEGAHWRWQRRAASPVFTHRNISNLAPIMSAAAETTCERLDKANGQADLFEEMVAATFEVISNVTFSSADTVDSSDIHKAIDNYIEQTAKMSLFDIIGLPTWVPRPSRMFRPNSLKRMQALANEAIQRRKDEGGKDIPDLLDLLLEGEDAETKRKMNTAELRDNLLTFIVAGHETTALTLAWALYLCAFDEEVQDKLRAEAQSVLDGRIATAEDCDALPYTEQVIKETLRLYPPAALVSRTAQEHDELCKRPIQPKDTVMLPIYALHRHQSLWNNPDQFDPERFADNYKPERYAYLPFGDGPRICIGAQFAMIEAKIILATLISRYKFEKIAGKTPKPVMIITLRPDGGVPLKVTPL